MPINGRYNPDDILFSRASSECIIRGKNNNPGVDADTQNVEGGICSGITSAWITSLLNANKVPEAGDTASFSNLFNNVLRFQGAYLKELHGKSDNHLQKLSTAMVVNGAKAGQLRARPLVSAQLPKGEWWAAYVSMGGHAIGIGRFNGLFHIMEPNFGLFSYKIESDFLADLSDEVDSYMNKNEDESNATFIFYARKTGASL